jgi:hypothetical protein
VRNAKFEHGLSLIFRHIRSLPEMRLGAGIRAPPTEVAEAML